MRYHSNLVFDDLDAAKDSDLNRVVGMYDPDTNEVDWLDDNALGKKYRSLDALGVIFGVTKHESGNYWISSIGRRELIAPNKEQVKQGAINNSLDESLQVSFENVGENAIELYFTVPSFQHYHLVGMVSEDGERFALRDGVDLNDFEMTFEEQNGEVVAFVDVSTIAGHELLKLIDFYKGEDGEDVNSENPPANSDLHEMLGIERVHNTVTHADLIRGGLS